MKGLWTYVCAGDINLIGAARVPIITFRYASLPYDCDMSVSNGDGESMTKLLSAVGHFDPRIRPLAFAIQYWMQKQQLGKFPCAHFHNLMNICVRAARQPGPTLNYALLSTFQVIVLVIHYLQAGCGQTPVLPPLQRLLRDNCDGRDWTEDHKWNNGDTYPGVKLVCSGFSTNHRFIHF
jgi:hypothetical protein